MHARAGLWNFWVVGSWELGFGQLDLLIECLPSIRSVFLN